MEWETPIDRMLRERAGKKPEKKVVALSDEIRMKDPLSRIYLPSSCRNESSTGAGRRGCNWARSRSGVIPGASGLA